MSKNEDLEIAGVPLDNLLINFKDQKGKKLGILTYRLDGRDPSQVPNGFEGWKKRVESRDIDDKPVNKFLDTIVTPPIFQNISNDAFQSGELPTNHNYKLNDPNRNIEEARLNDDLSKKLPSDLGANVGLVCVATCPQNHFVNENESSWLYLIAANEALPVTSLFSTEEMRTNNKNSQSQLSENAKAKITFDRKGDRILT